MSLLITVDTGPVSGAICTYDTYRCNWQLYQMPPTETKIVNLFQDTILRVDCLDKWASDNVQCAVEYTASPHRGGVFYRNSASSSAKFAANAACIRTCLLALNVDSAKILLPRACDWMKEFSFEDPLELKPAPNPRPSSKLLKLNPGQYTKDIVVWKIREAERGLEYQVYAKEKKNRIRTASIKYMGIDNIPKMALRSGELIKKWGYGDAIGIMYYLRNHLNDPSVRSVCNLSS